MNKLMIVVAFAMAAAMVAVTAAQSHTNKTSAHMPTAKAPNHAHALYACPKCEMASKVGGTCPGCKGKMVAIEATMVYACPKCHMTGKKGATCSHCKAKMVPSAMTYACKDCHTSAKKAGTCAKCGKPMGKTVMPMMGKG